MWIPVTAAGIINGIGHYWGYRNFACADASTNIVPWGIVIGGEELHNNHHAYGTSAQAVVAVVRVRHRLDVHPHPVGVEARHRAQGRAAAQVRPRPRSVAGPGDAAVGDHAPLCTWLTSYARSLKDACAAELANRKARAADGRRPRPASDVPSARRIKQWLLVDPAHAVGRRSRQARRGAGQQQGAGHRLRDAAGPGRAVGAFDRIVRAAARRGCRTGVTAPRRRALRRSRSSRCS